MSVEEYEQEYDRISEELRRAWNFPPNLSALVHLSMLREVVLGKWLKEVKKEKEKRSNSRGNYKTGI